MKAGESWSTAVCDDLTRTRILQFAGASGEYSPLHIDEPAARAAGHPSVMAHGVFCTALAARAIADRAGRALHVLDVRYVAPAWPGDTLTAECLVVDVVANDAVVEVRVVNGSGQLVLIGTARVRVTPERDLP